MPHAVLMHGRRGVGKQQFALVLAQSLLCEARLGDGAPCGVCAACGWFVAGNHPDFRLVQPEALAPVEDVGETVADAEEGRKKNPSKQIKIEQIRALTGFLNVGGHRGGYRVVLIHPAESMNPNAANSLLKSLEEPSAGMVYLLVSHHPQRLLATVRSRCSAIAMPTPDRNLAAQWLRDQGSQSPAALLAFAGDAPLEVAQMEADEIEARRRLFDLLSQPASALGMAEFCQRLQPGLVVTWVQKWSHDLLALASAGKVRYNPDYEKQMLRLAETVSIPGLLRFHSALLGMKAVAEHPLNARLFFDDLFIAYASIGKK